MDVRFKILLTFLVFITLFHSCGSDEITEHTDGNIDDRNAWTDSIFGTLSEENQYYQHLIIEVPEIYQTNIDSLADWVISNQPGALSFINWEIDSIQTLKSKIDTTQIIQPFLYADYAGFLGIEKYPYWTANELNRKNHFIKVFEKSNFSLLNFNDQVDLKNEVISNWFDSLRIKNHLLPIVKSFKDKNAEGDLDEFMNLMRKSNNSILLQIDYFDTVSFTKYRKTTGFEGLLIARTKSKSINNLIGGGMDLVFNSIEKSSTYKDWASNGDDLSDFQESTKRILNFKSKMIHENEKQSISPEIEYTKLNLTHNAVALIKDESNLIPMSGKFTIYSEDEMKVKTKVKRELRVQLSKKEYSVMTVKKIIDDSGNKIIMVNDSTDTKIIELLNSTPKESNLVICFSNPKQFESLKKSANLMFVPYYDDFNYNVFSQQLAGRIGISGDLVLNDTIIKGMRVDKGKLARTIPEYIGLDSDTMSRISWAVNNAMSGRAFPGCQILIAKEGCIVYDKSFGHHSYDRTKLVTDKSMYDLASLTKVVSTTMVGMKLYEMNSYGLNDSLQEYLPDSLKLHLNYPSTIRNITFNELFIHKSGMPAGFNILSYMQYTSEEIGRFDKLYCDVADTTYCIEVAENFYLEKEYEDSMWLKLNQIWLNDAKPYKYSDVNMNTLYFMFKSIIQNNPRDHGFTEPKKKLDEKNLYVEFLYKTFYSSLGMEHTRYKPLKHFNKNQIVPTENERYWRKQLLQGHVHDPNAALYGGIAGNAGMFSTTNDLAILLQMMLDKGVYDGKRYLNEETVQKFTSQQPDSHRGLGWNKPTWSNSTYGCADKASMNTYGHTGFTGTCIWVDPDNDLVYIFLSNRVHPTVNNRIYQYGIRKRVHQIAFEAMMN